MPPCGIPTFRIIIDAITVNKTDGTQIQYFYDANGNRVRKYDGNTNTYYTIGANGQTEAVKTVQDTTVNTTYNILVPQAGSSTGQDNIGQVRIDTGSYNRYYYLKDHLGSVRVTVDASGNVAGYNDFYPFGETMPGRSMVSSADPRYQYTGVENDIETGYDVTAPRPYDPWSGRFGATDPLDALYPSVSPYCYSFDNPIRFLDPSGLGDSSATDQDWAEIAPVYQAPEVIVTPSDQGQSTSYSGSALAGWEDWLQSVGGNEAERRNPPKLFEQKDYQRFRASFDNFSNYTVPRLDEASAFVALRGTLLGGALSMAGFPEFGAPVAIGANSLSMGIDISTGAITLANLSFNPSRENFLTFGSHLFALSLDLLESPLLSKVGQGVVIQQLKLEYPEIAPILLPNH